MSRFSLTPAASADLHRIWDYIASDSVEGADAVAAKRREGFEFVAREPRSRSRAAGPG